MKKLICIGLVAAMSISLAACGSSAGTGAATEGDTSAATVAAEQNTVDTYGIDKTLDIGVLVSDATSSEALAFRSYYLDYLGKQYDVNFIYSDELADAAGETTALENFINQGVQAVISLSSFDRPSQIETCEEAGIYYAIAAGTLTEAEYETYQDYEYYVGSVGPSLDTEYQTGYDMAQHYIDAGDTSYLIFGGAAAFGTDMHIYRVAGMLTAMCDADDTTSYGGATDKDGILAALGGTSMDPAQFVSDTYTVDYMDGYNMDDAWWGMIAEKTSAPGLQVVLSVGNGSDFFGTMVADKDIAVASVDSFTEDYGKAMEAGQLDWMAGKFNASVAPIYIAVMDAVNGAAIRTADGGALMLDQGYWEADSVETYEEYLAKVSDTENPAYTKAILDQYVVTADNAVTYDDFANFVGSYSFDEISAMAQ